MSYCRVFIMAAFVLEEVDEEEQEEEEEEAV